MMACWFLFHQTKCSCQLNHLQKYSSWTYSRESPSYFVCRSDFLGYCLLSVAGVGNVWVPLLSLPYTHCFGWGTLPLRMAMPKSFSVFRSNSAPGEPSSTCIPCRTIPFLCVLTLQCGSTWLHVISYGSKILCFKSLSSSTR